MFVNLETHPPLPTEKKPGGNFLMFEQLNYLIAVV